MTKEELIELLKDEEVKGLVVGIISEAIKRNASVRMTIGSVWDPDYKSPPSVTTTTQGTQPVKTTPFYYPREVKQ